MRTPRTADNPTKPRRVHRTKDGPTTRITRQSTRLSAMAQSRPSHRTTPQERAERQQLVLSAQAQAREKEQQHLKDSKKRSEETIFQEVDRPSNTAPFSHSPRKETRKILSQYASINVRTLRIKNDGHGRYEEDGISALADVWAAYMSVLGCGIVALQEFRIHGQTETICGDYRVYYSGRTIDQKQYHGVGLLIRTDWIKGTTDVQPINERLLWIYGTFHGIPHTIMVVYAPREEADEGDKDDFYQTLTTEVTKICQQYGDSIIIMGDFNAQVGTLTGFEHMDILGPFGIPDANRLNINGALLLEFCATNSLKVADTYFAADNEDYGTWRHSTGPEFIAALHHILVHESLWNLVRHSGVRFTDYALPPHRPSRGVFGYYRPSDGECTFRFPKLL